jgi:hypothetical protein
VTGLMFGLLSGETAGRVKLAGCMGWLVGLVSWFVVWLVGRQLDG